MRLMRNFLLGFLTLIMLTPSLACAMPVCADPVKAATAGQPCADHMDHHEGKEQKNSGKVALMKDCTGIELQVADNAPSFQKPDLLKDLSFNLPANIQTVSVWILSDTTTIRGPPPDWPTLSQSQPSILLKTQRLRI